MALGRERDTQTSAPGRKGLIYNLSLKLPLWVKAATGAEHPMGQKGVSAPPGGFGGFRRLMTRVLFCSRKAQLANRLLKLFYPCLLPKSYRVKSRMLGSARRGAGRSSGLGKGTTASCKVSWLSEVEVGQLFHLMPSFSTTALSSSFIFVNSPHFCDPFLNQEVFCSSGSFIFQNLDLSNIHSY